MPRRLRTNRLQPTTTSRRGVPLETALPAVFEAWRTSAEHSEQTRTRMSETVTRFVQRLSAEGVDSFDVVSPATAAGFVRARLSGGWPPELATMHARRTALRTLYRTLRRLDLTDGDPTLDLVLPPRGLRAARPLTDDEVTLCRASAQIGAGSGDMLRAVVWALGETGAVSSEITGIRLTDLNTRRNPTSVALPGTRRHDPRTGTLTRWGRLVVARRVNYLRAAGAGPEVLLAYGGAAPPGGAKAQASVCNGLRQVLDVAGLAAEADVRPASLRHWVGRRLYDAGVPIEDVAARLGCRSLDAAAEDIALDWREADR